MALQLIEMGFSRVYALKGGLKAWAGAGYPTDDKVFIREACLKCHMEVTPDIVSQWQVSKHKKSEIGCAVCHGDQHRSDDDFEKAVRPPLESCVMCHETQHILKIKTWLDAFRRTHNP